MKTLSTFILSMVIAVSSFAQYGQTVTVSFSGNGQGNGKGNNGNGNKSLEVVIDGRSYSSNTSYSNNRNDRNGSYNNKQNVITLSNLQIGQHSIVINRNKNNGNKYGNANQGNQAAYSSTFTVKQGYDLNIEVKGNGQVMYVETPLNYNNRRPNVGDRNRGRDRDYENRNSRDEDWKNNNGGYDNRRNDNGVYNNRYAAMDDATFAQLLQNVKSKWLQSGKISTVKSAFDNTQNYFSTAQVRQLLEVITSENNRLELAKASYKNVVDKNNFTLLYNLFSVQLNRDELDRYVRSYR